MANWKEIFLRRALDMAVQWVKENKDQLADRAIEALEQLVETIFAAADGKELMRGDDPVLAEPCAAIYQLRADTEAEYGSAA